MLFTASDIVFSNVLKIGLVGKSVISEIIFYNNFKIIGLGGAYMPDYALILYKMPNYRLTIFRTL